jgi:hypothetical protein
LIDVNVEGHVRRLLDVLTSKAWDDLWMALDVRVESFATLNLARTLDDAALWRLAQAAQLVIITANRNDDGPDSLESVLRNDNEADHLPVFTLANPDRILRDSFYAQFVAERLIDQLTDLDRLRGAGRLYLP